MNSSAIRGVATVAMVIGIGSLARAAPPGTAEIPEGETVVPYVYGGELYDSNLFRVSGDDEARDKLGTTDTSEWISRAGAGVRSAIPVSLQTFRFDGWVERNHYRDFDTLNHTATDLNGAWDWQLGRLWEGTLDLGYSRQLSSFDELQEIQRDMKRGRRASLDAGLRVTPDWEVIGGAGWRDTDHDERDQLDRQETWASGEIRYHTPVDTRVGLRAKVTEGDMANRELLPDGTLVSNDYEETEYSVVVGWEGSVKSDLEGRFGYTRRDYDERTQRDFQGFTSRVDYRWRATAKTTLNVAVWRELETLNDEVSSYVDSRGVRLKPVWQATPKTSLYALLDYRRQIFDGAQGTGTDNAGREDNVRTAGLGVGYEALRNLRLHVDASGGRRDSNVDSNDYRYRQVFAGLTYAF